MAYRDKNNVDLFAGDVVEKDGHRYRIHDIKSYSFATVAIVENLETHSVDSLLLQDIRKLQ